MNTFEAEKIIFEFKRYFGLSMEDISYVLGVSRSSMWNNVTNGVPMLPSTAKKYRYGRKILDGVKSAVGCDFIPADHLKSVFDRITLKHHILYTDKNSEYIDRISFICCEIEYKLSKKRA